MSRIESLIAALGLEKHPEGGFYKECYKSEAASSDLPAGFPAGRGALPFLTSIYYLLEAPDYSAFHRIKSDELWYFHEGTGMVVHAIEPDGAYRAFELGPGASYFCAVKAGSWFGAEPSILAAAPAEPCILGAAPAEPRISAAPAGAVSEAGAAWALVSCAVAPGFDFRDFELADGAALAERFPRQRALIERLTRQ